MRRTTIMLPDDVDARLRREARRRVRRQGDPQATQALMLIVDAGPLYAAAATRDRHHKNAVEMLTTAPRPLIVPALVVTEVAYLLADRIGPHAEVALARSLAAAELLGEPVLDSDW